MESKSSFDKYRKQILHFFGYKYISQKGSLRWYLGEGGGKWAGGELDSESRSGIALRRQEEEIKKVKWESRKGNMRAEREIRKQKGK